MKFAHLHLHSEYSLLDGAIKIKELVKTCEKLDMPAVAVTDHGNMFGAYKFNKEIVKYNKGVDKYNANPENTQKKEHIKGIIGCEFYISTVQNPRKATVFRGFFINLSIWSFI